MTFDVPEGGGSAGSQAIRAIVMLTIVFGPWVVGVALLWIVIAVVRKRRREALARRLEQTDSLPD